MKNCNDIPLDQILKALGDPIRLGVLKQLLNSNEVEKTCGTFDCSVGKATFSHHIKILLESHILCERLEGTKKYLSINPAIKKTYPGLIKTIRES